MRQFSIILFLVFFPIFLQAQQVRLEGKVTDESGLPLENAHIHIGQYFALAKSGGEYSLNLPKGEYRINVTFLGFREIDTLVNLQRDRVLNFVLEEDMAGLDEVMISAIQRRSSSQNIERVSKDFIQEQFSGSLAQSLERIPGVNAMEIGAGTSKPIIRGLGFNRVAVSENGIKQEGQQWGADHGLEIDALNVEGVEIKKGVGAIEYGSDAIGGVVEIINDRVPEKGLSGEVIGFAKSVNNTLAASTNLSYRKDKFFYKIKATATEFGDYNVPTDNIIYLSRNIPIFNERLKNTAGKENNLYAQLGYFGEQYKGSLSFSNVYFKSGFFPGAHGVPSINRVQDDGDQRNIDYPFQRVNHFKILNKNEWFFSSSSLSLNLGFQNNHRQEWSRFHTHYSGQQPADVNPDLELDFNLNTWDAQLKFSKTFSEEHESEIGLQTQHQNNNIAGFNFLLPEYDRTNYAAFFIHKWQATQNTQFSLGGRFDISRIQIEEAYDPNLYDYLIRRGLPDAEARDYALRSEGGTRNFRNFNLMAGALFNLDNNWDLSFNTGSSFRLPTAIELGANGIHHGSFRHERGDFNLSSEQGYVLDAALNYRKNSLSLGLSPYVYYFSNYIFLNPSGEFSILPHAGQIYQFTQSEAVLAGVEFNAEKQFFERLHTAFSFEYLYNRQLDRENGRNYPLPFTPPVNGFAEVGYTLFPDSKTFENTEISANTTFALEQDRIAQNEEITPGYQLFGAGLSTNLNLGNFTANLNFRATNIFNTRYFNHTNFYRALEIPEMGRNLQLMIRIPIGQ
ncbi:TonB-dependent receptor [Salegentibacter sp. HM20]